MRKITQFDRKFLISQFAIILLCVLRVCKWTKIDHAARLLILDDYNLSIFMSLVMCLALFLLYMFAMKCTKTENRNKTLYLMMMISLMVYPTYAHNNYLGAMDIYGIIIGSACLVLIMVNKAEWLSIILMAVCVFINPLSILSFGLLVPVTILYKGFVLGRKKELIICLCVSVVEILSLLASRFLGMYRNDAQQIIDIRKFIAILVFLLPFIIVALIMFYNLIKKSSNTEGKIYYIISLLVGIPGFAFWAMSGDYTRAFVNLFLCYGLWLIVMLTYNDKLLEVQIKKLCVVIKKWVPVNAVIVIYIAAIMIFWIAGIEEVDTEKLLELVVE